MLTRTCCAEVHAHILAPCEQLIKEVRIYLGDTWDAVMREVLVQFPRLKAAVLEQASISRLKRQCLGSLYVFRASEPSRQCYSLAWHIHKTKHTLVFVYLLAKLWIHHASWCSHGAKQQQAHCVLVCVSDDCLLLVCLLLHKRKSSQQHISQPAVYLQVEKHLDDRQHAAQTFVKTLVTHAKRLYTEHPHYKGASGSTMHDIDRYGELVRLHLSSGQGTETLPSSVPGVAAGQPSRAGPSSPIPAVVTSDGRVIDPNAEWWRLKQMEHEQPAAWVCAL